MPPVRKAGGANFQKDVEFAATKDSDEYELEASGIVMVPDKADLQNDFAREETIREFTEQFAAFEEANQAGGGIMHAVWPDGWMELTRNEVLEESEEIGGQTVEAGAWVQTWGVTEAKLAELIDDNILSGYSIGAIQVDWGGPYEQTEVDDVDTSEIPDDEMVWELIAGIIREVSAVDIPAVPDAEILEAKSLEKRLADHVGNPDAFLEEAMERGHSEGEAERLWDVMNEAMEADGSAEPGKQSLFHRAGKAFFRTFTGSDDGSDATTSPEDLDPANEKEGRTLSRPNRHSLYATIDSSLDVLEDAGDDHGMTRFTDREDTNFDLSEHSAREWPEPDEEEEEDDDESVGTDGPPFESAAEGDTSEAGSTDAADDMTDNDTNTDEGEEKDLAEQNAEQISDLTAAIEDLTKTVEDDGQEKDANEQGEETDLAEKNAEQLSELSERIDAISKQTGTDSQQIGAVEEESEKESGFTLDPRKTGGN